MTFIAFFVFFIAAVVMLFVGFIIPASQKPTPASATDSTPAAKTEPEPDHRFSVPGQLLDLSTTTIGQRQRYYKRGFFTQRRYDVIQRQAEAANDLATLEALRTNTYTGSMPEQKPDGTYTHYTSTVYTFSIAGINFRKKSELRRCTDRLFFARLIPEPDNQFDPDAIKIIHEANIHVGYVPSSYTSLVHSLVSRSLLTFPALCFGEISSNTESDTRRHYYSGCIHLEVPSLPSSPVSTPSSELLPESSPSIPSSPSSELSPEPSPSIPSELSHEHPQKIQMFTHPDTTSPEPPITIDKPQHHT